jgi:hypothetical protein
MKYVQMTYREVAVAYVKVVLLFQHLPGRRRKAVIKLSQDNLCPGPTIS